MMLEVACKGCGSRYRAPEHTAGKALRCKKCGQAVTVPAVAAAAVVDTGLEIDPSMLELALQKESPKARAAKPAAPKLDAEEAKFAALLSAVDHGVETQPVALPPAPKRSRAERKAAKQRMKEVRAAQKSGTATASALPGEGFTGPMIPDRSDERYGHDELSKLLAILSLILFICMVIYAIAQVIKQAKADGEQVTLDPLGLLLAFAILAAFVVGWLGIMVPLSTIGVLLTGKMMRFRVMSSVYLNTLGWMSIPTVCGGIGMIIGGDKGFSLGVLIGMLLIPPAVGYLNGLRIAETIVACVMTWVGWILITIAAGIVLAILGIGWGLMNAEPSQPNPSAYHLPPSHAMQVHPPDPHTGVSIITPPNVTVRRSPVQKADPLSPFEQLLKDASAGYGSARSAALTTLAHREPNDAERPAVSRALNRALSGSLLTRDQATALQAAIHWDIDTLDTHLIKALSTYDKSVWMTAAKALAAEQNPAALPTLLDKLRNEPEVAALIRSYGTAAEPAVREALAGASYDSARVPLVELLAEVGTAESVAAIKPFAESSSAELAQAARAAWRTLAPKTYDPVALALSDLASGSTSRKTLGLATLADAKPNDAQRRQVCAAVLGYAEGYRSDGDNETLAQVLLAWKDPTAVRQLKDWLGEDASTYQRRAAIDVLSRGQEPGTLPLIQRWVLKETDLTVAALIRYGEEAEAPMVGLLDHRNEAIAAAACRVLAEVGTKRCLSRLRSVAEGGRQMAAAEADAAIGAIQSRETD